MPPPTETPAPPATIVDWLGLRIELPEPWEVVRHSWSARKGSLAFADRARQRMQVIWTACVKRPDVGRLLDDYQSRLSGSETSGTWATPTLPDGWRGRLHRRAEGTPLLRAARYDATHDRLLEVALELGERSADGGWMAGVLAGVRSVRRAEDARRLRAFGVSIQYPPGWRPTGAQVLPADVSVTFSPSEEKPDATVTLRRRGMAGAWFDGDLEGLIAQEQRQAKPRFEARPNDAVEAWWDVPGPRFRKLLGRHRVAACRWWHDPADTAVYEIRAEGPAPDPPAWTGFTLTGDALATARGSQEPSSSANPMLAAVPVRNRAVRAQPHGEALMLFVAIRRRWWMAGPVSWWLPLRTQRGVALDPRGREVWDACDGATNIEQIVERFAERHGLSFHEARLTVGAFLKRLVARRLVVLVGRGKREG
jgi:hypothetical protein